mgnify:CR=1 FL=1
MNIRKKRKKVSRMRGSKTHGIGFMKKGRGSGHRGGKGMAGTGKRADHRKTLILNMEEEYFGKESLKAKPKNYTIINVSDLERLADGKNELNINKYKILGNGEIKSALIIHAKSASKKAIVKVEKAGGKILFDNGRPNKFNETSPRS